VKRTLIIVAIVVVLCLLIVAGYFWGKPLLARAKTLLGLDPELVIGPAKDFTVNLLDPGLKRYLRIRMAFQYLDEKALLKELESRDPQITDAIIGVLRTKSVDYFMAGDDTAVLREELIHVVNQIVTKGQITDVYFLEIVIQ